MESMEKGQRSGGNLLESITLKFTCNRCDKIWHSMISAEGAVRANVDTLMDILEHIETDLCEDCNNRFEEIERFEYDVLCVAIFREGIYGLEVCIEDDNLKHLWNGILLYDIISRVVDAHDTSDWGKWRKFIYARDMMYMMLMEKWYGVRIGT